ncbi:MAG: ADP-ribosylglycohydrolase family protein [Magnetococcus sp. YQC-5]
MARTGLIVVTDSLIIKQHIRGALLGTALGDATGLVTEGLSRRRLERLDFDLAGPALLGAWGMMSDDGDHACMTAQALILSGGDPERFSRALAWRLRFWLLGLPAGMGLATGRAILKLWMGFPPHRSGVFSAGTGPAMRAPIIGAAWCDHFAIMRKLVSISTRMTHTDPKAEWGALAVAMAAAFSAQNVVMAPESFVEALSCQLDPSADEFLHLVQQAAASAKQKETASRFAERLGLTEGVGGYVFHTVPIVLQIWMRAPTSYEEAIQEIIRLGGDTDTTAAILGGILGAGMGMEGLPTHWLARLQEWPRSQSWMIALADRLLLACQTATPMQPPPMFWPGLLLRNLIFLIIVLFHGFRRLLPPW